MTDRLQDRKLKTRSRKRRQRTLYSLKIKLTMIYGPRGPQTERLRTRIRSRLTQGGPSTSVTIRRKMRLHRTRGPSCRKGVVDVRDGRDGSSIRY